MSFFPEGCLAFFGCGALISSKNLSVSEMISAWVASFLGSSEKRTGATNFSSDSWIFVAAGCGGSSKNFWKTDAS